MQVALLSLRAANVGIDFSCASAVVFAELPTTADVLRQAEGRAHRAKVKSPVTSYVLLCQRTVEVRAWLRLSESSERTSEVLGAKGMYLPICCVVMRRLILHDPCPAAARPALVSGNAVAMPCRQ